MSEPRKLPLWKNAAELLLASEWFTYDAWIEKAWLEEQLGEPYDSNKFKFAMIELRDFLKELGYFLTEDCSRGFRVMTPVEVPDYVRAAEFRKANNSMKHGFALSKVDFSNTTDEIKKAAESLSSKCLLIGSVSKTILRRRKAIDSSASTQKSLNQILGLS